jgi:hypothetical protein
MDSEHIVRKMFYNTIGGRRPLGKPKRRWIAQAEENSRKVLSVRYWKGKLSVYKVWSGNIEKGQAKYLCVAPQHRKAEDDALFTLTTPANNVE